MWAAAPTVSRAAVDGDLDLDHCPTAGRAMGDGTLAVGAGAADFGTIPEACVGSDVWFRLRGKLLIAADAPDFYGNVDASGNLRLRWAIDPRWAVWLAADVATYRFVQNAVVKSSAVDVGPPALGVARALVASRRLALALHARVLLPLDSARVHSVAFGGELGVSASAAGPRPGIGIQGGADIGVPVTAVGAATDTHLVGSMLLEAWASGPRLGGTLGGFGRATLAPGADRMSSFGARAGGRLALRAGFWLAAVTEVPLVGQDRTDLILALFTGYTPRGRSWR